VHVVKPTAADALAGAARQLQYALDGSTTVAEAFQKLYAAADPRQQTNLRQLESLLGSPESDPTVSKSLRLSSYPTLAWLLRQTLAPERSAAPLIAQFRRHLSFSATTVIAVWSEFAGFLWYLGAVLGLLIVVLVIYERFVLPSFTGLYGGLGAELPALTALVFGRGVPWFMLMLLLATVLLAFLYWFVFYFRRLQGCYLPLPAGYQIVPLIGPVAAAYNQYIWLSYAGLLRAARMPADQALRVAGTRLPRLHVGQWDESGPPTHGTRAASGLIDDLSIAARLGKLDEECQFQQEATTDAFLRALVDCRRRARIVLTVFIYFLVAAFVSAMYLPIFSLGSAI
jgi:type II secretory pathway component PulF